MREIFKKRDGVTLVEVVVACALLTVMMVGISAIFISTNRIYGAGTDRALAKEFSQTAVKAVENRLSVSCAVTLKNHNFSGDNIQSRDGTLIICDGGEIMSVGGGDEFQLSVRFFREGDDVVRFQVDVIGITGKTLYTAERVVQCLNVSLSGGRIYVQDGGVSEFSGLDFAR